MPYFAFRWTDEAIEHLALNGVAQQEFEDAVLNGNQILRSRSSDRPCVIGRTRAGRRLMAEFEILDDVTIEPVTAYDIE